MKDVGHLDVCLLGRLVSHSHAVHLMCFSKELEQKNATRRQASGSNVTSTTQSMEMVLASAVHKEKGKYAF